MAKDAHSMPAKPPKGGWRGFIPLGACFALLFGVSFLPPDTSLSQIDKIGRISVCVPQSAPPLVTGDAAKPGFEIELVREIAQRAGWRLSILSNAAMTRDINPRSWHINRAQCQFVAGGVVLSDQTRGYMDASAGHLQSGWAMGAKAGSPEPVSGDKVGFLAGLSGLNRIALGQHLRTLGLAPVVVNSAEALKAGLDEGRYTYAITDAFAAGVLFGDDEDYDLSWVPGEAERFALGFGFWKGDTTLKRRIEGLLHDIEKDGTFAALGEKYGLDPAFYCSNDDTYC